MELSEKICIQNEILSLSGILNPLRLSSCKKPGTPQRPRYNTFTWPSLPSLGLILFMYFFRLSGDDALLVIPSAKM